MREALNISKQGLVNYADVQSYVNSSGKYQLQVTKWAEGGQERSKQLSEFKKQYQAYLKEKKMPQSVGGYFVDPKTGQGISSMQDLTKQGYVKVGTVEEIPTMKELERRTAIVVKRLEPTPSQKFLDKFGQPYSPLSEQLFTQPSPQPHIEKRIIDYEQGIPVTQLYYVDGIKSRKATPSETKIFYQEEDSRAYGQAPDPKLSYRAKEFVKDIPSQTMGFLFGSGTEVIETDISLPYQSRGTSYYEPDKGFYAPTTKITTERQTGLIPSLLEPVKDVAGQTLKIVNKITPIPIPLAFVKNLKVYDEKTGELITYGEKYKGKKYITYETFVDNTIKSTDKIFDKAETRRQELVINVIQKQYEDDFSNLVYEQNKEDYDTGKITWEEAVKKSEKTKEWKSLESKFNKGYETKLKEVEGKYKSVWETIWGGGLRTTMSMQPTSFGTIAATVGGAGLLGGAGFITPRTVVGVAFSEPITKVARIPIEKSPLAGTIGGDIITTGALTFVSPGLLATAFGTELAKGVVTDPYGTITGAVEYGIKRPGVIIGGFLGGYARTEWKASRTKIKVNEAMKKIEIKPKLIQGLVNEVQIKAMDLSPNAKAELIGTLKRGGSVKKYNIQGYPGKGFEKFTPDVKGEYLVRFDAYGKFIDSYGKGKIKVTYKGKAVDVELYNQALMEIESATGKIRGVSDVVTKQIKKGKITKREKVTKQERLRFVEDTEILLDIKGKLIKGDPFSERRIVISQTQAKLLSQNKYLGEKLLKEYTSKGRLKVLPDWEFLGKEGKPYAESITGEIYKPLSFEYKEGRVGDIGLIGGEKIYSTLGEGISRRVKQPKPKPKPSRAIKGLYDKPPEIKGVFDIIKKEKLPQVKQVTKQVPKQYPKIVGGTGAESVFAGQQFKVPSGTEQAVFAGIGGIVPGQLVGGGSVLGGLITGFGQSLGKDFGTDEQFSSSITDQQLQPTVLSNLSQVLEKEKQEVSPRLSTSLIQIPDIKTEFSQVVRLIQPQAIRQQTKQKIKTLQKTIQVTPQAVPVVTPITTIPTMVIPFFFPGEKKVADKRVGYYTEVKTKGKWKKVTERPHTRQGAIDIGARIVDNTLSAQFKINPIMQTKKVKGRRISKPKVFEERLEQGDGYFNVVANKFRSWVQRKGKRIQTKNRWLEKKGFRSDTQGESQGLTVAQIKGRQTRIGLGLPLRRTKKTKQTKRRFRL